MLQQEIGSDSTPTFCGVLYGVKIDAAVEHINALRELVVETSGARLLPTARILPVIYHREKTLLLASVAHTDTNLA